MTSHLTEELWCRRELEPFGVELTLADTGTALSELPMDTVMSTALTEQIVVLRGCSLLDPEGLERYCLTAGDVLRWNFGAVLDLLVRDDPDNYLFDAGDVPFHWDGAFPAAVPRVFLFQCRDGGEPGAGGETVFCDTTAVYRDAPAELRTLWQRVTVTYRTDQLAHYGGVTTTPLLADHPRTGRPTIRYAEPLDPARYRNPLFLTLDGVTPEEAEYVMGDLRRRLHDPRYCYVHSWRTGDVLVAENHTLLHGRNAFTGVPRRHLQRIQIL